MDQNQISFIMMNRTDDKGRCKSENLGDTNLYFKEKAGGKQTANIPDNDSGQSIEVSDSMRRTIAATTPKNLSLTGRSRVRRAREARKTLQSMCVSQKMIDDAERKQNGESIEVSDSMRRTIAATTPKNLSLTGRSRVRRAREARKTLQSVCVSQKMIDDAEKKKNGKRYAEENEEKGKVCHEEERKKKLELKRQIARDCLCKKKKVTVCVDMFRCWLWSFTFIFSLK